MGVHEINYLIVHAVRLLPTGSYGTRRAVLEMIPHQLPPDAGVVLTATLQPGSVWDIPNLPIAMHGQPTEDDAHVPIIFWGRGVRRGSFPSRMNTVDIAPTLGVLLGVTPLSLVDGHARTEILAPRN